MPPSVCKEVPTGDFALPAIAEADSTTTPVVLLVEDHADTREMYALFLTASGFRVAQAEDANLALGQFVTRPPDVAVIDIALPGIDGFELCRQIRQHAADQGPALVAITGLCPDQSLDERVRDAGFDTLLFKPCTPEELKAAVQRVLARSIRLGQQSRTLFTRVQQTIDESVRSLEQSTALRQSSRLRRASSKPI